MRSSLGGTWSTLRERTRRAVDSARGRPTTPRAFEARRAVTIDRPIHEVRAYLRDPETLRESLHHAQAPDSNGGPAQRFRVEHGTVALTWATEIAGEAAGDGVVALDARSEPAVEVHGVTRLSRGPEGRGTEVRTEVRILPRRGPLTVAPKALVVKLAEHRLGIALARAKQVLEAGEIATAQMHPEPERGEVKA
jgi:uncharacterized membrane protein